MFCTLAQPNLYNHWHSDVFHNTISTCSKSDLFWLFACAAFGRKAYSIERRSNWPSEEAITTVPTPLPIMLVNARHSDMNLSTPKTMAIPGTSSGCTAASVDASVM